MHFGECWAHNPASKAKKGIRAGESSDFPISLAKHSDNIFKCQAELFDQLVHFLAVLNRPFQSRASNGSAGAGCAYLKEEVRSCFRHIRLLDVTAKLS